MIDLLECRNQIDKIDDQLIRLLEERIRVCENVAAYKIETGKQVLDIERERAKIAAVKSKTHGEFNSLMARELFGQIMAISRKRQYQLLEAGGRHMQTGFTLVPDLPFEGASVVFQGEEGAYSSAAMRKYFEKNKIKYHHVPSWREAMEEVVGSKADYAVLPIENSTAGSVGSMYDLLMEYDLYIVGEETIRVDHVLLGLPEAELCDIRKVISHPQALAQCQKYLEAHPGWSVQEKENTAAAAKEIREDRDPSKAAIASREAGRVFDLRILDENLCENLSNSTRFIVVGRNPVYTKDAGKVSICFELPHETGTLYNMLSHIFYNGLNMTKIESRPIQGKSWEYRFFIDFEGNLEDSSVRNAIAGLKAEALRLKILGNYSESRKQDSLKEQ